MVYDYHAGSGIAHFNAPLFAARDDPTPQLNVDASVQALLNAGIPASKIVVGVPFYARAYGRVASRNHGLFQTGDPRAAEKWGEKTIDYQVLMGEHLEERGFTRFWDAKAQVPWLYNAESQIWITYDDAESVARKAAYARAHGLGGVMFWEQGADNGTLLNAIHRGLRF
jgi:chitinase